MMMNPIYEREQRRTARNSRYSLLLLILNTVLVTAALLSMAVALREAGNTGELQYAVFLKFFRALAWMEFAVLAVLMPARTAGSISGERERGTLDLLRSTQMKSMDLVLGNLFSELSSMMVLLVSAAPVFAAVLLYGGVQLTGLLFLFLSCVALTLLVGSAGMFFSSRAALSSTAAAETYALLVLILFAPYGLDFLLRGLGGAALSKWVLFLSPLTVYSAVLSVISGGALFPAALYTDIAVSAQLIAVCGIAMELLLSLLLLVLAEKALSCEGERQEQFSSFFGRR
ncbi:ABC-type transport system involved in multi-copper enzyme maturation permease subunit [Moryella indoligenes]|uniref:ABC-type transport system involved in multi-copper enzyme maturation permease subunit n=1 Tax=Moryella indoligenes TaxID=371674 RepID=A0AAE3V7Q1_9FIRM|nr:ABC transporter permease subunit [Moryella indoligenes]MDQ0151349.1 ABC-type transport system involved in multi-copper enzyme maturation permease subunit [Moryella indoligenes]